MMLEAKIQR